MSCPPTLLLLKEVKMGLALASPCAEEGLCEQAVTGYWLCGSGYWQLVATTEYECVSGQIYASSLTSSISTSVTYPTQTSPAAASGTLGQTGYSFCQGNSLAIPRIDNFGRASYTIGGKMASVYVADHASIFRCGDLPQDENYFAAFWTQWNGSLTSQPAPINCGDTIRLVNPLTNATADALVIDRCASCVGVAHQPADPTLTLSDSNGATIDLSEDLWNVLFDNAPFSVYDIEYDGPVLAGWSGSPLNLIPSAKSYC